MKRLVSRKPGLSSLRKAALKQGTATHATSALRREADQAGFFDLPAELRNIVYQCILSNTTYGDTVPAPWIAGEFTTLFPIRHPWPKEDWRTDWEDHAPTRLATYCAVSKQFGSEFRSAWLSSWSAFRISLQWLFKSDPIHLNFEPLRAFLQSLGEQHRKSVTEVHAVIPYPAAVAEDEWQNLEMKIREACDGMWHEKLVVSINVKVSPGPWMRFGTVTSKRGITEDEVCQKILEIHDGQVVSIRMRRPTPSLPPTYLSSEWYANRRIDWIHHPRRRRH